MWTLSSLSTLPGDTCCACVAGFDCESCSWRILLEDLNTCSSRTVGSRVELVQISRELCGTRPEGVLIGKDFFV